MLEKEMHDAMDPNVGQDVVGEMKREIHRMQLRHAELMKLQEKLVVVSDVCASTLLACSSVELMKLQEKLVVVSDVCIFVHWC